jgi:glycosyltransferase involved in cell wall biosynthesis
MTNPTIAIDASRAMAAARTGTEWYSAELITALAALTERPPLVLYHRPGGALALTVPGVQQRPVHLPRLWTHVGLSFALARDRPSALFVPSHVIPLVHPRATVVTIHDLGYRYEPEAHPRTQRWMLELTTRWNARVARRIIAVSSQTRADLIEQYRVPPERIEVVHSGLNHERFAAPGSPDILRQLGVQQPYLLFLSTVQPRKNVVRLIEAFEALGSRNLSLVVAGRSGWLAGPIETRIAASPNRDRIIRLGHVPDDVIPALYNGAEAFVLPSLYEGFGMGVLEAMACGCPVVTSNRSSLPEVAGKAAILVDPHDVASLRDGLQRVLQPSQRAALSAAGRRRAAEFTWERTARQTLAVIEAARHG